MLISTSTSRRHWLVMAIAASVALCAPAIVPAQAERPLFVPLAQVIDEIDHARSITICVFTIDPRGLVARHLEQAARRGVRVAVVLDGEAFGAAASMNEDAAASFTAAGIRVRTSTVATHLKAAVFDGERIYLSDKNFATHGDALVLEDPYLGDRLLVERAMLGTPGSNEHLWLRKADALAAEAQIVASRAARDVDVQTESFGAGQPVYRAMAQRAREGDSVRLLVYGAEYRTSPREREAVGDLRREGVEVRIAGTNEKLAISGARSFFGSANQTSGLPDQIDFGFYVGDSEGTARIRQRFDENWRAASPVLADRSR